MYAFSHDCEMPLELESRYLAHTGRARVRLQQQRADRAVNRRPRKNAHAILRKRRLQEVLEWMRGRVQRQDVRRRALRPEAGARVARERDVPGASAPERLIAWSTRGPSICTRES